MSERASVPSIHHVQVAIPTGGEDQARWFFGTLLELEEIGKPENLRARGGVWFQTGNLQLHLGIDPSFAAATKAHVAFEFVDLVTVRERLSGAGFVMSDDESLPGFERFYVSDPFGNRIECLSPLTTGDQALST